MMNNLLQLFLFLCLPCAALGGDIVIIVGAPGTPEFGKIFTTSGNSWEVAAKEGQATVTRIGTSEAGKMSDLKQLGKKLGTLAEKESKPLWIVLIGHGTFDGREAKFNLRGEDLSASMLAKWLKDSKRPIAVINTSASSAPFLKALSKKDRIVMTATKSGTEDSYARFGQYLSESINSPGADIDQDGATSLLEAFLSATKQVKEFYKKEGRIVTEQALVDDNGDKLGTPADFFRGTRAVLSTKDNTVPDGFRAQQWHLVPSESERNLPAELRQQRDKLETELFALRARKKSINEETYFTKMERIARALAKIYQQAEQ